VAASVAMFGMRPLCGRRLQQAAPRAMGCPLLTVALAQGARGLAAAAAPRQREETSQVHRPLWRRRQEACRRLL